MNVYSIVLFLTQMNCQLGGVWTYDLNDKGVAINKKLVGIVIGSPNARRGSAPCKDGHRLYFLPYSAFMAFSSVASSVAPAP